MLEAVKYLTMNTGDYWGTMQLERKRGATLEFKHNKCTQVGVHYFGRSSGSDARIVLHAHLSVGSNDGDIYTLVDLSTIVPDVSLRWKTFLGSMKTILLCCLPLCGNVVEIILGYLPMTLL